MAIVIVHDATHQNIGHLPPGPAAGYTTGSPSIRWTGTDWQAHPGAVRIDQDFAASDPSADCLDVERGAATPAECPGWVKKARADFAAVTRPGQREPVIYCSASSVTPVVNALIAGGVTSGVGLWVANWDLTKAEAVAEVEAARGPFPIVAVQYANRGLYDTSSFDSAWLGHVSSADTAGTWGKWETRGHTSLEEVAAQCDHLPPSSILRHTATHYGAYDPVISAWLNAVFAGRATVTEAIPAGGRLWVRR